MEGESTLTDLLLVPLEDTVVFPGMTVTLTVDVGDEDRVLLVPRHDSEYTKVGTVAEVTDRVRLPGGARAVSLAGLHRGVIGAAHTDPLGRLRAEVEERPDESPPPVQTRELEREYRAVVEEILELRGEDDRVREFLRAITEPGALADTCAYAPDLTSRSASSCSRQVDVAERLELSLAIQRERLAELQVRRRIRDDVESGAQKQQREWFLRKPDELDPQGARRGRGLRRRGVSREDPRGRDAGRGPRPGRARAAPPRDDGRRLRRVLDDPHLPRLADGGAVVAALRGDARPGGRARGARRRPRGPRGRQGPDRRVPGRAQAAPGPRHRRTTRAPARSSP